MVGQEGTSGRTGQEESFAFLGVSESSTAALRGGLKNGRNANLYGTEGWLRVGTVIASVYSFANDYAMLKRDVLSSSNFGQRIAEEEGDALQSYFVETDQWKRIFSGEVDVVYGQGIG